MMTIRSAMTRSGTIASCILTSTFAFAQTDFVEDRTTLAGADSLNFNELFEGLEFMPEDTPVMVISENGMMVEINKLPIEPGDSFAVLPEGLGWLGNFSPGELLLSTNEFTNEIVPIEFSHFDNVGVCSFGLQIQPVQLGSFDAQILAYDDQGEILGIHEATGLSTDAGDNSALFLGIESDTAMHVVEVSVVEHELGVGAIGLVSINSPDFSLCESTPELLAIDIDIKPGSTTNSLNLCSNGNVPVAILSTDDFDVLNPATGVDPNSITLADANVRTVGKGNKLMCGEDDVNDDGLDDLVCKIPTVDLSLNLGTTDSEATLKAVTFDGQDASGSDSIRIVKDC